MTKEEYLILKKEANLRLLFIILLVILGAVLSLVMIANHSPYHSFMSIFTITMFGLNFGFLFPCWQRKKAIEAEHPDWKKIKGKDIKILGENLLKSVSIFLGTGLVLIVSFFSLYRPVVTKPFIIIDPKVYESIENHEPAQSSTEISEESSEQQNTEATSSSSSDSSANSKIPNSSMLKEVQMQFLEDLHKQREEENQNNNQ